MRQPKSTGKFQHLLDHGKIIPKRGAMAAKAKTLPKARTHGPMPRGKRDKSKYLQLKKTACNLDKDPILRGEALDAIRQDHLYRFEFANFELFCRHACGISRSHANRFMRAALMWHLRSRYPELPRNNVELLCRLLSLDDVSKLRQRVWTRTLEISRSEKAKPNRALIERAISQIAPRSRSRRIGRARSEDMDLISRFFDDQPGQCPPLSLKQRRLAMYVGLETLEALLGPRDRDAAEIIKKLQTNLRRLWRSTRPT